MTIIDEACWERGCPCHDDGESAGIEVVRKEWVGLTDEEILTYSLDLWPSESTFENGAKWAEAKLKEKNT